MSAVYPQNVSTLYSSYVCMIEPIMLKITDLTVHLFRSSFGRCRVTRVQSYLGGTVSLVHRHRAPRLSRLFAVACWVLGVFWTSRPRERNRERRRRSLGFRRRYH